MDNYIAPSVTHHPRPENYITNSKPAPATRPPPPIANNTASTNNSPYIVQSRTPIPPTPAYDRTSPTEHAIQDFTTDHKPHPAYDNEIPENMSHPIDAYFDY